MYNVGVHSASVRVLNTDVNKLYCSCIYIILCNYYTHSVLGLDV